jgi:hypothetical protein
MYSFVIFQNLYFLYFLQAATAKIPWIMGNKCSGNGRTPNTMTVIIKNNLDFDMGPYSSGYVRNEPIYDCPKFMSVGF